VALTGLLAGLLLPGRPSTRDEPVALLVQALSDLLAHAVQLGLAAQLDLARNAGSWLAMIQLAARSSACASQGSPRAAPMSSDGGAATQSRYGAGPAASTAPCSSMYA
jgi:hypothetical protein